MTESKQQVSAAAPERSAEADAAGVASGGAGVRAPNAGALVTVAFASNDDHGSDTERAEAVNLVSEECGNVDLCCQMPHGQIVRRVPNRQYDLRVGRRIFRSYGWTEWYGNMAWNATRMRAVEAQRLLRYLLDCGYTVEGYDCGGPFAAIIEEHEAARTPAVQPEEDAK